MNQALYAHMNNKRKMKKKIIKIKANNFAKKKKKKYFVTISQVHLIYSVIWFENFLIDFLFV
jgi:hypothetical protein